MSPDARAAANRDIATKSDGARAAGDRDVAKKGDGARAGDDMLVAIVEKRGKFWAAEPYFPAPRTTAPQSGRGGRGRRRIVLASNRVQQPRGGGDGGDGGERGGGGEGGGRGGGGRGTQTVRPGDLALVRLGGRGSGGKATVVRAIGRPDVARDAIEALMLDRGLAREFAPGVLREAEQARAEGPARALREVEQGRRRDLRDLPTLTIDPASAKDFDDAISAQLLDGQDGQHGEGIGRVWVHIADVSAYVPEGSSVDREARRRGTSVYVPGAVEPMLPQALSNDACSLMPQVERAAVTVQMDIDVEDGKVVSSAAYRSLISSDMRLDYDRVDRIFAGRDRAREPWQAPLEAARRASRALGRARERAGGLVLDSEEPEIVFDEQGNVSEIRASVQTESHRLIEHLMIAANEAVARRLAERKAGCLYRVHERPEPERVVRLIEQLASLGVPTPPAPAGMSGSQAAELMGEVSQRVERHVRASGRAGRQAGARADAAPDSGPWHGRVALTSLVLRSLKQAYYSPRNLGHAGLHSPCYCHFTSPIRRYPDLVCHRALIATLDGEQTGPQARGLAELGEWTSERERDAMQIERDADDVARCYALEQLLYERGWDQTFTGEVTGLISAGAFVAFGDLRAGEDAGDAGPPGPMYEGMLPVRRMRVQDGRDWWELNELGTILRGERSGMTLRLGDSIELRVARVDTVRGRVDLAPAD